MKNITSLTQSKTKLICLIILSILIIDCKKKDESGKNLPIFALLTLATQRSPAATPVGTGTGTGTRTSTGTATGITESAPTISLTGSPFSFTVGVAITNITPTITGTPTSCTSSPTLPAGLAINAINCVISGTPTATSASTSYTMTATNATGSGTANLNISVSNLPVAPTISYTGSPFVYTPNIAVNLVPVITGTGISNCASAPVLPAGLSINATTCAITGTATATQAVTARTITITGNAGTATANINIAIGKRIFVTASNTANGNLGAGYSTGIEGADGICNGVDVNKPSTGTYKAMIVDGTSGNRRACSTANCGSGPNEGLDWVLSASTPYYRTDLTTLIAVTNANKIFSFNLSNPIQIAAAISWSSLQTDWLSSNTNCNQWTSNSGAVQGNLGDSSSTTSQVLSTGAAGSCNSTIRKLICVEQ